jgi:hypothetical protein
MTVARPPASIVVTADPANGAARVMSGRDRDGDRVVVEMPLLRG